MRHLPFVEHIEVTEIWGVAAASSQPKIKAAVQHGLFNHGWGGDMNLESAVDRRASQF